MREFNRYDQDRCDLDVVLDTYEDVRAEIAHFLKCNSFLVPLLEEAAPKIRDHFGMNTRTHLELFRDPEGGTPELFANIGTSPQPEQANNALDAFDAEWWLEASIRSKSLLNFSLRYI